MNSKRNTETVITYGLTRNVVGGRALTQRQPGNTIPNVVGLMVKAGWAIAGQTEYSALLRNAKSGTVCRARLVGLAASGCQVCRLHLA